MYTRARPRFFMFFCHHASSFRFFVFLLVCWTYLLFVVDDVGCCRHHFCFSFFVRPFFHFNFVGIFFFAPALLCRKQKHIKLLQVIVMLHFVAVLSTEKRTKNKLLLTQNELYFVNFIRNYLKRKPDQPIWSSWARQIFEIFGLSCTST